MLSVAFGLADNRDILAFQTMDSVVSASNIRCSPGKQENKDVLNMLEAFIPLPSLGL